MIPVFVARVLSTDPDGEDAVVLQEITSKRSIKIRVSPAEMLAIRGQLDPGFDVGHSVHEFMARLLQWHTAKIVKVLLMQNEAGMFYSTITVKIADGQWNVSAEPADAIMLALRNHVSIWLRNHPGKLTPGEKKMRLQQQLRSAIEREAFEEAARLRDLLRELPNQSEDQNGI
jgi:bifunctional DNase/RNase